MVILNAISFLIITIVAINYMNTSRRIVANPCAVRGKMMIDGTELFWILTFSTGLLAFSADVGLDLMALRLMALEVLCVVAIVKAPNKVVWSPALFVYFLLIIWMSFGLTYGPKGTVMYGVRTILKYLYAPLIAMAASAIVRDYEVFVKASEIARMVALVTLVLVLLPFVEFMFPGVVWTRTARAIHYISLLTFSLAMYFYGQRRLFDLICAVLLTIPCFVWVFRTSIMGSLVAVMAFAFIRWRTRSLPVIAGVLVAGVLAVFFIPSLYEKMFRKESQVTLEQFQDDGVTMDQIDSNGRQAMWKYSENKFFRDHEIGGSGTGNLQRHFYNDRHPFAEIKIVHSDFVQQKCDNGLVGLWLYGAASLLIFLHCCTTCWGARDPRLKLVAITAGASIVGVYVTHYSDNVVNYSMATLSMPWGFYGMMLGIKRRLEGKAG